MLGYQLRRAVRQQLVLLDDNVSLSPDRAEIAQLDPAKVRPEDEDVVEFDVEVAQVLGVDPLEGGPDLAGHALRARLTDAALGGYVGGEVAQGRVLGREHVVAVGLERIGKSEEEEK